MKRRSKVKTIVAAAVAAAALTACGGSSGATMDSAGAVANESYALTTSYDYGGEPMISNGVSVIKEMDEAGVAEEYDVADTGNGATQKQQDALADRKLIKNVDLSVETEEYDALIPALEQQVASLGGYIESMNVSNRVYHYTDDMNLKNLRSAYMTARIPKENLDFFVSVVAQQSNIVRRSESVTDVTLQYVDLESHKKALVAEQDRLLELMDQAETVEDIITIEGRLSEVRYQIESMESQLRTYDNKIDYSTVNISIDEVEVYSPNETTSAWQRISSGFVNSLRGVGRGIGNFTIWFIIHIPYFVVWAVIIVVILLIVKAIRKVLAKRRMKKDIKQNNPYLAQGIQPTDSTGVSRDDEGTKENNMKNNRTES